MTRQFRQSPDDDPYRDIAPFYDMAAPSNVEEIMGFWDFAVARHASRPVRDVLEFACGTGRVLLPLARRGHLVVGTDSSQPMLAVCRKRAEALGLQVALRRERIEDFDEPESQDALVALFGTIAFLSDDASVRRFFTSCFKALRPGGLLLVDVPNALDGLTCAAKEVSTGVFTHGDSRFQRFLEQFLNTLDGTTIYRETWIARDPTGSQVHQTEYSLRLYSLAELRLLVEPTPFRRATCYCNWLDREPMQPPCKRLILILEKTLAPSASSRRRS
jgi:SAM-dependent methyltransferase